MKMARMLIDAMSVDEFEPEKFTNKYHDELLAMIDARANGKELPRPKKTPARSKVVNLMDVLAKSLEESKKRREQPRTVKRRRRRHAKRRQPRIGLRDATFQRSRRLDCSCAIGATKTSRRYVQMNADPPRH